MAKQPRSRKTARAHQPSTKAKPPAQPHDSGYKLLFSHPAMVADLLKGFVAEDWVRELDFTTLEKQSGSYVSDDLRPRAEDVVWRVRWRDRWLYVYLLLEFQSEVDPFMAVRLLVYVGLLYQDLTAPSSSARTDACRRYCRLRRFSLILLPADTYLKLLKWSQPRQGLIPITAIEQSNHYCKESIAKWLPIRSRRILISGHKR